MSGDIRELKQTLGQALRALALVTIALASTRLASAQCSDPTTHFRGGLWKQWILQITPGPSALAAVERIITEINGVRATSGLPLLVFDPEEPLAVGIIEENNPRGPDGALLPNRRPNQEIFLATFAEVATGGEVVLFLTDPLRSNADLTAKGVPGVTAVFERTMKSGLTGADSDVSTRWVASTDGGDQVKFSAEYTSAAITFRSRFPGPAAYLTCNMAKGVDILFRSLPTQTFGLYERAQTNALLDLTVPDVTVKVHVRHHDPDVNAMFNDPDNRFLYLFEIDRVVRFERQP